MTQGVELVVDYGGHTSVGMCQILIAECAPK